MSNTIWLENQIGDTDVGNVRFCAESVGRPSGGLGNTRILDRAQRPLKSTVFQACKPRCSSIEKLSLAQCETTGSHGFRCSPTTLTACWSMGSKKCKPRQMLHQSCLSTELNNLLDPFHRLPPLPAHPSSFRGSCALQCHDFHRYQSYTGVRSPLLSCCSAQRAQPSA